jgi:hypothetical protein
VRLFSFHYARFPIIVKTDGFPLLDFLNKLFPAIPSGRKHLIICGDILGGLARHCAFSFYGTIIIASSLGARHLGLRSLSPYDYWCWRKDRAFR